MVKKNLGILMTMEKWRSLEREEVFRKYGRAVERVRFMLPNNTQADYYIKKEGPVVCTLALTVKHEVILVTQYRPGPDAVLHELPGGGMDDDADPMDAAARELLEETGYKGHMRFVAQTWSCGYSTLQRYCFVATDCVKVQDPQPDEREFLEVRLVPMKDFKTLVRRGNTMTDVDAALLGLDALGLL